MLLLSRIVIGCSDPSLYLHHRDLLDGTPLANHDNSNTNNQNSRNSDDPLQENVVLLQQLKGHQSHINAIVFDKVFTLIDFSFNLSGSNLTPK